jgi:phospholipase/carboxylesterase
MTDSKLQDNIELLTVDTQADPDCLVLWLHGLGADGYDFEPIVPALNLPPTLAVRFLFPHAPKRSVTLNQNMMMRAWYDIFELNRMAKEDIDGIKETEKNLTRLLDEQITKGFNSTKIVLIGFSQGGAMALHVATRYPKPLAGVMGLSTYLPLADELPAGKNPANKNIPIFLAHGTEDTILPLDYATSTRAHLEKAQYKVEWHVYEDMAHSVCPEEIEDISRWLQAVLKIKKQEAPV